MGRNQWPEDDQIERQDSRWLLGRLWERSEQQMDFLRDMKTDIQLRLEDGMKDFRALAVADATMAQQILRNTQDVQEIRKQLAMKCQDGERPTGLLNQLTELLRMAKEFVEAVAPLWKITLGVAIAVLLAKGIVDPDPYLKALKLILRGEPE